MDLDFKQSVRAATTANITLSGTQTVDGVSLSAGDRVLVKNQSTASQNGIYVVQSSAWTRSADASENSGVTSGLIVIVEQGSSNSRSFWFLSTANPITVGTTNLTFNNLFDTVTETVVANGNSGSGITLSLSGGTVHTCTLTNNCVFTMPATSAGKSFTIFLNTGSGNYTASFTGVLWNYSSAPTITTAANKVDILSFISDGTYWYGSYSQNYG